MRLFIAINLSLDARREIVAATSTLRACVPEIAWVSEERLHLTLKFLGERQPEEAEALRDAIAHVAGRHRELLMAFGGVGAFPNFRRARVVWLGVDHDPRLELLHHDIEIACQSLGIEVEGRPFRPHVTLGRRTHDVGEERLRELRRTARKIDYRSECIVRTVDVMRSELSAAGPAYTTLVAAALRSD